MRDPERIEPVMKKLENIWKKHPDLRLGQLILNAHSFAGDSPLYYIEDKEFIKKIENVYGQGEVI